MRARTSGLLLHITSLPGDLGCGDLGPGARLFLDFLIQAGQRLWQILPLGPTSPALGNSPYSAFSAFAGNPLLLSPERLVEAGWLAPEALSRHLTFAPQAVDYPLVERFRLGLLRQAFAVAAPGLAADPLYARFCREQAHWLEDYALFVALKDSFGGQVWSEWPEPYRDRHPQALAEARGQLAQEVAQATFVQYLFHSQWQDLRRDCRARGVLLVGDAPIYVTFDSADVWSHPELFKLDAAKRPTAVAGVPPDYFSATGQRWGNPVYHWPEHARDGYAWWLSRLAHNFGLFDLVRIDHFRGFAGYWEVPAHEETAVNGRWVEAPGLDFFAAAAKAFPSLPIIAEDLGVITPDVRELRDAFGLPGMKILQFAFHPGVGRDLNAPHHHPTNAVVYPGTHDNDTSRGWFHQLAEADRERLFDYLGCRFGESEAAWHLVRAAWASPANLALAAMQDVLGLGSEARMNTPSLAKGNWGWRVTADQLSPQLAQRLAHLTRLYGRD